MKLSQVDKSGELCFHDNSIIETKFKYIQCFHFSQLNNIQVLRISVQQRPALMSLKTRTIIALQMVTKQLFIFSKISSYFSLKYALSVSHSQCFLESGKTRFALGSQKKFYKSQFLRSQIHALRFLPGQWDDSREKQISPTPLQNPCRDGKWDYIHPLPLSLSWELGICCKKCNLSPKYHQSLTFSDYYEKMCTIFNQSHIF